MDSILSLLQKTKKASGQIRKLTETQKSELLEMLAKIIENAKQEIISENKKDLDLMNPSDSKYDRLLLNEIRIQGLADSLREVAKLSDPSGKLVYEGILENGLKIKKIAVPMGVVG